MFVHLHVHSPFSFLDGASPLGDILEQAAEWEMPAIALTDHNNVSGAVEFQKKALALGIKPIQGAEITTEDGSHLTLLAENKEGYKSLCRLLTAGYASNQKRLCRVPWQALKDNAQGLIALSGCHHSGISQAILRKDYLRAKMEALRLVEVFGADQVYLEMINSFLPFTKHLLAQIFKLHQELKIPLVATNNVHYLHKENFPIHDLLVCTRTQTKLSELHPERPLNGENYFASTQEMKERFVAFPEAIQNTLEIAQRCTVALDLGQNLFPRYFPNDQPETAMQLLTELTWTGANKRYKTITPALRDRIEHELNIIERLDVADYFLAVWDLVQYAQKQNIRYAGRGSAADSVVVYCLEITNVDAFSRGLLFERFLSLERAQKPDIDIDFDARYRDQVAEYVYQRYGAERVASVCMFQTYHARSALRDLGKALGYSTEELGRLTKNITSIPADGISALLNRLPELKSHPLHQKKYAKLLDYCAAITGFPRQIGTHLGGLVISGYPLTNVTPLQPSAKGVLITQFDKHTIEDLGLIKIDLLSLRTLSAVSNVVQETPDLNYNNIPTNDQATFTRLQQGETVGVFQLESPAQRSLQSRLQADRFEDLVASVALIRPGPIKGNMVDPFIARRHGEEAITYIHPKLEEILAPTYGVVLYQEQVIEIATKIAGFTPGEADRLRKVMTKFRSQAEMESIGENFIAKAIARGVDQETAEVVFSYIVGYAGYGFCEAHAAAFADTAYRTAYLLEHYPAQFYAALLNHQPIGFYPPNTLCVQARNRGITILPLHINDSDSEFSGDENAIRIGLKQVKGMEKGFLEVIAQAKGEAPFRSVHDFVYRTNVAKDITENLILAGAFDWYSPNRRALLWDLPKYYQNKQGSLFLETPPSNRQVQDFHPFDRWLREYAVLGLSACQHVMDFFRPKLPKKVLTSKEVAKRTEGTVQVAGLVIRPHRPPTRSGKTVVFLTLEDEFGLIDVTIFESVYKKYGKIIYNQPLLLVTGEVSRRDPKQITSINATHIQALV